MRKLFLILSVGLMSALTLSSAQATVITLAGGDSGEGFAPLGTTKYAYNIYGSNISATPANQTIQTVTFLPFDVESPPSGFTVAGTHQNGTEIPFNIGASTSDDALEILGTTRTIWFSGTLTFTLGGLTAGNGYQVDLFVFHQNDGNTYAENFSFNGGQQNLFASAGNTFYDVREFVVANGSGQIILTMANDGTTGATQAAFGRFNAFAVTVPEPTAVLVLGVGGLLLLSRGRQKHA